MSRNRAIFFLILVSLFSAAQTNFDWYPVHPSTNYNYSTSNSAVSITRVIKIDSSSSSVYHLNKIVSNCDTCHNSSLVNDYFDSTYVLNHQAQFLNHTFQKITTNAFYFKGPHSFQIYPFAALNTGWLYDSTAAITASVISRNIQNVLGNTDSVSAIKLSNNDTILLSKKYGLLKFPVINSSGYYNLVGLEGAINFGIKLKRFHDFFNFNVGDVFNYSFLESDYNILPPLFRTGHERWDFIAVNSFQDSVVCRIRNTHFDSLKIGNGIPLITSYTKTITITFKDSLRHLANFYPLQEISVNPFFVFDNGIPHIHKVLTNVSASGKNTKQFGQICPQQFLEPGVTGAAMETGFSNIFLNKNSAKITGRELTEGLGFTSELYNDYSYVSQRCLVGYIKATDTVGTIYGNPLSVKNISNIPPVIIYPIPADQSFNVHGEFDDDVNLSILNSLGEKIHSESLKAGTDMLTINTSDYLNGLYFIVISNLHFHETKKLLIQH